MANDQGGPTAARVLDPGTLEEKASSAYPAHLSTELEGRVRRRLGDRLGIRNFGVNLLRLAPRCVVIATALAFPPGRAHLCS